MPLGTNQVFLAAIITAILCAARSLMQSRVESSLLRGAKFVASAPPTTILYHTWPFWECQTALTLPPLHKEVGNRWKQYVRSPLFTDSARHVQVRLGNQSIVSAAEDFFGDGLIDTNHIMIVSHADDETIFGWPEFLLPASREEGWLVVICNNVGGRGRLLSNVTRALGLRGIIALEHFDKYGLSWYDVRMVQDIEALLRMKAWGKVVTHERRGEYGNTQHQALNVVVSALLQLPGIEYGHFLTFSVNYKAKPRPLSDQDYRLQSILDIYGPKIVKSFFNSSMRNTLPPVEQIPNTTLKELFNVTCVDKLPIPVPAPVKKK